MQNSSTDNEQIEACPWLVLETEVKSQECWLVPTILALVGDRTALTFRC